MDTLFVLKDTVSAHVIKVVDSCPTCVHEAQTNWADVQIVKYICLAIIVISFFAAIAFYLCQKAKYNSEEQTRGHEIAKANNEAKIEKEKKDDELKRYQSNSEFDLNKEQSQKTNKTDYERAGEFIKQMCDATKDKEGKLNNAALETLIRFFHEEWRDSKESKDKKQQ